VFSNEEYLLELLVEAGKVTQEDIDLARKAVGTNETVIEHLISSNKLEESDVAQVLAVNAGVDFIDLDNTSITAEVFESIPEDTARRFRVVPVADDGLYLTVAMADPLDFEVLDTLPHVLNRQIITVCATQSAIRHLIRSHYGDLDDEDQMNAMKVAGGEDVAMSSDDAPIIRLVFNTLQEAFKMRASDIHIEPLETSVRVRFRVDGKLIEVDNHPKKLLPAIIARLKVMSGTMSIAEKRLPQDGRIQIKVSGKDIDLRVSSVPSNHGESIVMRILDKSALMLGLPELGFFSDDQETFERLLGLPDGILLVTGPTGSGKTTTLYACLNVINRPDRKIITVEDPVEYEMPGINQVMVKTDIGMTFANALRAMLRQAPNIIISSSPRPCAPSSPSDWSANSAKTASSPPCSAKRSCAR